MRLSAAAALAAFLAASSPARAAAAAPRTRTSGTVLNAEVAAEPSKDGAGSLVIVDKAGRTSSYAVDDMTRVTRDGKGVKFDNALIGDLVVRAKYDPKTKVLTILDLKSSGNAKPAPKAAASGPVRGEVAFTDALKGLLSVRTLKGRTRDFAVVDATKVLREKTDAPAQDIPFESVSVGDSVEVRSKDGKTADEIRVRAPAR